MGIFMSIFLGAVVAMAGAQTKAQSVTQTSANLAQAFVALDKTVRYAAAISAPGTGSPSGDWYVEYRTTNSGVEVCTQLRVDIATKQLQRRSWQVVNSAATGAHRLDAAGLRDHERRGRRPVRPTSHFVRVTPAGHRRLPAAHDHPRVDRRSGQRSSRRRARPTRSRRSTAPCRRPPPRSARRPAGHEILGSRTSEASWPAWTPTGARSRCSSSSRWWAWRSPRCWSRRS